MIDWFDILAVQGTLKSLLQYQFFGTEESENINSLALSLPYGPTLTSYMTVGKVMSLHFNMLSRFIIAFLPRASVLFFFNINLF